MQIQKTIEHDMKALFQIVMDTVEGLRVCDNVAYLSLKEIRRTAESYGARTVYGNYNFVSAVKNRSAWLTVCVGTSKVRQHELNQRQEEILRDVPKTVELVDKYAKKAPLVCVETTMGENSSFNPHCILYVSVHRKEMIRLAYMIQQTLFPFREGAPGPKLYLLFIPEGQEKDRQILVFPEIGVT